MTSTEAVTRPGVWRAMPWKSKFRVGRVVDDAGTVHWHRGRRRRVSSLYGGIITFRYAEQAMARAGALNLAAAEASKR